MKCMEEAGERPVIPRAGVITVTVSGRSAAFFCDGNNLNLNSTKDFTVP